MKKIMSFGMLLVCAIAFSGCDEVRSPQEVLGTAAKAVKDNDLRLFRSTLAGVALEKLGNAKAMNDLRQTLLKYENLKAANIHLVHYMSDAHANHAVRIYSADILADHKIANGIMIKNNRIMTATVACYTDYFLRCPRSFERCTSDETTRCVISSLD